MKPIITYLTALLLALPAALHAATVEATDVLSSRDGRFHLDGQPFAEISFNKFDLLWQLYDQRLAGKTLDDANSMVQAQEADVGDRQRDHPAGGHRRVYWWCYQSDRPMDQTDPQRFDLTRERNPELLNCIIEANRRLREKLSDNSTS